MSTSSIRLLGVGLVVGASVGIASLVLPISFGHGGLKIPFLDILPFRSLVVILLGAMFLFYFLAGGSLIRFKKVALPLFKFGFVLNLIYVLSIVVVLFVVPLISDVVHGSPTFDDVFGAFFIFVSLGIAAMLWRGVVGWLEALSASGRLSD